MNTIGIYSRRVMLFFADIILVNIAFFSAMLIRFDSTIPTQYLYVYFNSFIYITISHLIIFSLFSLYKSLWKYASVEELISLVAATLFGACAAYGIGYLFKMPLPRSVYIIAWLITTFFIGGFRLSYRILRRAKKFVFMKQSAGLIRVLVVGAGDAGSIVIKEMLKQPDSVYYPVAVVDDANWKQNTKIHGVPVKGKIENINELVQTDGIDEIIIAMPSVERKVLVNIINKCKQTKCKLKTLPGVYELINDRVSIKQLRDVSIEDLLGRDEIKLNMEDISEYLEKETVMVTGGGGSIGCELCRQIAFFKPKKLLILDNYENNAYDIQNELLRTYKDKLDMEVIIASVRDMTRLKEVFAKYRPGVVFHAAAHKHVPLMEANPSEAVKNNVFGTLNVAQCAEEAGVKRFVFISTDKAVNPTSIMGATKRIAEMIIQSMDKQSKTEFVAVRFGNVLGSNGSVVPLFKKQIENGGPVTITHPEITRYFMTIPEAVRLVIQAGAMAKGGEIFVLDMGKPVKIIDLAKDLISLSGYEPEVDIKLEITGLRPGEKLYEELLLAEEGITGTRHEHIFIGKPLELSWQEVQLRIKMLENSLEEPEQLRECIKKVVPTFMYKSNKAKNKLSMIN